MPERDLSSNLNGGSRHDDSRPQHIHSGPSESGRLTPTQTGVRAHQHQSAILLRNFFDEALNLVLREVPRDVPALPGQRDMNGRVHGDSSIRHRSG